MELEYRYLGHLILMNGNMESSSVYRVKFDEIGLWITDEIDNLH